MKNEKQEKPQAIAEIKERVQIAEWQRQIEERQSEGLSVAAWCERQGIGKSTYYYRLRKIREYICQLTGQQSVEKTKAEEKQQIIPIPTSVSAPCENRIEIISGDLRISFVGETTSSALKAVIEALRSC